MERPAKTATKKSWIAYADHLEQTAKSAGVEEAALQEQLGQLESHVKQLKRTINQHNRRA
jgi:TolA-binding protein